jgi:hypothetical protein
MVRLYESGESELALSKRFGIARSGIRSRLIAAGIKPRSQGEAEKLKWSRMSAEERATQVSAAHKARRGRKDSLAKRCQTAQTNEKRQLHVTKEERKLAAMLKDRGITTVLQKAIGPYNCDLGAPPVAIERFGGNWHWYGRHFARTERRFRYIMGQGWHILVVTSGAKTRITDKTIDLMVDQYHGLAACKTPTYLVMRGDGVIIARGTVMDDKISIGNPHSADLNVLEQRHEG